MSKIRAQHFTLLSVVCLAVCTLTFANAEQADEKESDDRVYRVMSLKEMFDGDPDAMKKVRSMMVTVSNGDSTRSVRTDMDAKDYERALNRLAADGWSLVAVNKSNYWVFERRHETE
jgi:hypothetical protein